MKRYQCIKNFYMSEKAFQMPGELAFKAGKIYPGELLSDDGAVEFESEISPSHSLSPTTVELHFQELLDLHVDDIPRDEADREPFTTPEPRRKLTVGWAWFIALVITIGFFILKAFTE